MCAVSREVRPIDELIRFVVAPTGEVMADLKRKLPGRGLWVSASRRVVAEAVRRHQFSRGFKRDVNVAATLPDDTEALLVRSAPMRWRWPAKAGRVVSGFAKVEDALTGPGRRPDPRLRRCCRRNPQIGRYRPAKERDSGQLRGFPIVTVLTSAQLDLALGRSNVIHAALLAGPASKTFLSRCQLLVRYRMADDDKPPVSEIRTHDHGSRRPAFQPKRLLQRRVRRRTNEIRTAEWLIPNRLATRL